MRAPRLRGGMLDSAATPEALARVLLGPAVRLKRGENVIVESWTHTLPFATACVVEARRRGGVPLLLYEDEEAWWRSRDAVPSRQMGRVGSHEWAALARAQAYVFFPGPADVVRFRQLPTADSRNLVGYNHEWYRRARSAHLRGVRSLLGYASDVQAAAWHLDGPAWREQLIRGSVGVDLAALKAEVARVAARVRRGKELRVTASNGTDFTVRLRGRAPQAEDGVVDAADVKAGENMATHPPGWVAVAIDENSARGLAVANRPSFPRLGRTEGGQWEFEGGRLRSSSYADGQAAFEAATREAAPGWDRAGLLTLGLNPGLAPGTPMVEDQEAGAVTIGIGGNAGYGGSNRSPFVAWITIGEATVALDGRPLVDRGKVL